jgi:hypothetical protein
MIVFLISGLWHGANWTFIAWGALNGFYLVFALMTRKLRNRISRVTGLEKLPRFHRFLQIMITFILCCFAWIFFRANNISEAFFIIKKIFTDLGPLYLETDPSAIIYSIMGIGILLFVEAKWEYYKGSFSFCHNSNWLVKNLSYAFLIIMILLIGVLDGGQFIYFQF